MMNREEAASEFVHLFRKLLVIETRMMCASLIPVESVCCISEAADNILYAVGLRNQHMEVQERLFQIKDTFPELFE